MLASVAEQASKSLTWLEIPKDKFSHNEVHINVDLLSSSFLCEMFSCDLSWTWK